MFSFFTNRENNDTPKISFEDIQTALQHPKEYIIINTLPETQQTCLITGTIDAFTEERKINEMMNAVDVPDKCIVIYGKNDMDDSPYKKYKQLRNLGIVDIRIYSGGMFEWLLLQDIYGMQNFPTTSKMTDILKYKPDKHL